MLVLMGIDQEMFHFVDGSQLREGNQPGDPLVKVVQFVLELQHLSKVVGEEETLERSNQIHERRNNELKRHQPQKISAILMLGGCLSLRETCFLTESFIFEDISDRRV